jgi:pyroglutamyl-peptidase
MAQNPLDGPDAPSKPNVLVTGFGPFPGVPLNVSGDLAIAIQEAAQRQFPDHAFHSEVLPTEWRRAPERISELYADLAPVLALHFGVAAGARAIRIERLAQNTCRAAADAVGLVPGKSALIDNGAATIAARLPLDAIYRRLLATGVPVELSDNAGGYLCNAVLYHALSHCHAWETKARVGFIHIPRDLEGVPLSFAVALEASLEIIKVSLAPAR